MMPREIAILDAYIPTVVLMCIIGAAATWAVDRLLAYTGIFRFVWHPALFRASLLVCICGGLSLAVYR
ncbi:DUF1656 domain-containing protein [Burkholderia guangdongensis]|uniref:DUF1656 domain-containing protein n=1 Tax=Burkholderia guangdongensis TaxID=1792500 RepID=UPI0015CEA36C|nr:DUF1656 domain-containing protein [Burkholderia guangdongensis]